jgi:hypothetical protein
MVARLRSRPGKFRLGCLLGLLILGAIIYYGYNIAQVALRYYEYKDAMEQEARFGLHQQNDLIVSHLRAKADTLNMPDGAYQVRVKRRGNDILISADYIESIELPGFVYEVDLHPQVERVF